MTGEDHDEDAPVRAERGSSAGSVADAFGALASEHRVEVLRAFADAERARDDESVSRRVLSFTDIYDALDVDSTSQLSYHLDSLTGGFLRKTGDGYALTRAGEDVMRAILAGSFTGTPTFEPIAIEGDCPRCVGRSLEARYADGLLSVRCADCGARVVTYDLSPAAVVGRCEREVLAACDERVRREYAMAVSGSCSKCGGVTEVDIERRRHDGDETPGEGTVAEGTYYAVAACQRCKNVVFAPLAVCVLDHPAVVSFLWEHGVNAAEIPFWDVSRYVDAWDVDVASVDPLSATVTVRWGGDALECAIDDDLSVSVD